MGIEIERKFLVIKDEWFSHLELNLYEAVVIKQGYLNTEKERTVRVRTKGTKGFITIKGKVQSITRQEFEYEIPAADAVELLSLCNQPLIEKLRYKVEFEGTVWEVDVFSGENEGLVMAEVELKNEHDRFSIPNWIGIEVSDDPRFYNLSLSLFPYKIWKK
jgi:adenylate cyclase